jgi:methylamine---glutamate N-methyltransferase subunit B
VGARSGIDQKGGTILVGGNAGMMTGFMLQRGRQVICGNVGGGLGDSMYDGAIYVGGKVASLGVDCVEAELDASDDEFLARKLGIYGIEAPASWRKFVCGRKLWNYDNLEPAERKLVL